jgi:hypothetical protein
MNNLSFFIGIELVPAVVMDFDTVQLTVPELQPGTHTVRVIKHESHPGRDIVAFSADIEVGGERVLASITGNMSPGGGRLELPNIVRFELTEESDTRSDHHHP